MIRVHKIRLLIVVSMILMLASMVTPALADCTSTPNGSGANFTCTDITTVVTGTSGSDNITNNGTILTYMWGGGFSPNQSQQDVLTNNGVVGSAEDDDGIWGGAGNDTIINNGVVNGGPWTVWNGVNGAIFGDDTLGVTDDDTIIINSVVHGNIHGDFSAGGDDTITINGRVNGGVYGEGHESVQFGRYGNDTVILTNNAIVTTIIDGMGGNDRLRFDFEVPDEATYIALSNQIANANPASGSLTFNGNTFTWVNFEILENSVEWTGAPPNQPPTAAIAAPTAGQVFTADGSGSASVTLNAAGSSDSDGTITGYAWSWTGTSSGAATGNPANRSFGVGSYTLTLTVTDDDGATDTETRSFTVQPPAGQVTLTLQPTASANDVNEDGSSFSTGSALWIGNGSSATNSWLGVRFTGVNIPAGATIQSAYLEVYATSTQWTRVNVNIRGEAVDNSPLFTTTTRPSQRSLTSASTTYNVDEQWTSNSWRNLGSVLPIIQEIVGRPNWQSGNSLSLLLKGMGNAWGRKSIGSFDANPAFAPRLVITYIAGEPVNQPPTAVIAAPTEGQVFTADGSGNASVTLNAAGSSDSDGTIASYAWSWTGTASGNATGSSANRSFGVGSYSLMLTVTDDDGATDTETRSFTVQAAPPPNQPPTAVIAAPTEGQVFTADSSGNASVTLNAAGSSDSDGTIASYAWSWTGTASGSASGGATAQSFGVGSYTVTLTVTDDDGATDTETRAFSVQAAPNLPPTISPIPAQSTRQGVTITPLTISASDPNNDPLTISVTNLPDGLDFDSTTRQVTGTVAANATTRTVTVSASDSVNPPATLNFLWTIVDDLPPTFSPANQTHTVGAVVNLSLNNFASDPEGLALRFELTGGSLPPGLTLQTTGEVTGTISGSPAVYTPTIAVIDSVGQSVTASFTWTVQAAPSGPVTLTLQPTASTDDVNEDGSSLSTSGSLWVGNASSASNSWLGVRFTGVNIPQGATITSAQLEVFAISNQWILLNMNIAGEAVDNSATFSTSNRPSQRALTTAQVTYNTNQQWNQYNWYNLGNVAAIVQEIVNRPNWQSGNSLSLLLKGMASAWSRKSIASWDNNPIYAPRLTIEYTLDGMSMTGVAEMILPEPTAAPTTNEVTPVVPAPVAAFTSTALTGEASLSVQFSNTSTGGDSYHWDFGDGTSSTETNPVKAYSAAGSYTVVLTVTNAGGTSSAQATVVVTAPPEPEMAVQPPPEEVQPPALQPADEDTPLVEVTPEQPPTEPEAEQTPEA